MTAAEYRKITCPFCSGHIECSAKDTGIVVNCPHCAQELVLELPPVPEQRGGRYLPIQKPKPTRSVAILVAVASGGLAFLVRLGRHSGAAGKDRCGHRRHAAVGGGPLGLFLARARRRATVSSQRDGNHGHEFVPGLDVLGLGGSAGLGVHFECGGADAVSSLIDDFWK